MSGASLIFETQKNSANAHGTRSVGWNFRKKDPREPRKIGISRQLNKFTERSRSFISPYFTLKYSPTCVIIEIDAIAIRPTPIDDIFRRIKCRMRFASCTGVAWPRCGQFMAGPRLGPGECTVFLKNKDLGQSSDWSEEEKGGNVS